MKPARTYRMTIASTWYDKAAGAAREYELHFKIARHGRIRNVRRHLAARGAPYFQRMIYRRFRKWTPKRKLRISFEREESATRGQDTIAIEARRMEGRGRRWKAFPMMGLTLPYSKKRRRS